MPAERPNPRLFVAIPADPSAIERLAVAHPTNPFYTSAYAAARSSARTRAWILSSEDGSNQRISCLAFSHKRPLTHLMTVDSLPNSAGEPFWEGLAVHCRVSGISNLRLGSFATTAIEIPDFLPDLRRRERCEWIVDLTSFESAKSPSPNHRRNIRKAVKNGLRIVEPLNRTASPTHVSLCGASLLRRQERGESASGGVQLAAIESLLEHRAGRVFQAVAGDVVLSSVFVLMAGQGAYYHSAGTTPEGMKLGASHFLLDGVMKLLQQEACTIFNLGGAGEMETGLVRFKKGFSAQPRALESAKWNVQGGLSRWLRLLRLR